MYILYFDGASKGNPGKSSAGWILFQEIDGVEKEVKSGNCFVSKNGTNNEAEYTGLIRGLEMVLELGLESEKLIVKGDSKLVINQVNGSWRVKADNLKSYHKRAILLKKKFKSIKLEHVLRHLNKEADALANYALEKKIKH